MMLWLQGLLGTFMVLIVLYEIIRATLLLTGAGPIALSTSGFAHWLFMRLSRFTGRRVLSYAGIAGLLSSLLIWALLFWMGWTLIFGLSEDAVVSGQTGLPAGWVGRAYFTGYTLVTLGVGDYVPGDGIWQLLTVVASVLGFFLLTLVITYLLPMVSAHSKKRQVAAHISSLGRTPRDLLERSWNGSDYRSLDSHLNSLMSQIHQLSQQHLAYPVLHYLYSAAPETSLARSLALLDETLTLLSHGANAATRPPPATLEPMRDTLLGLLETLNQSFLNPAPQPPPAPDQTLLREDARQGVSHSDYVAGVARDAHRRRLLLAWLKNSGWDWESLGG